MTRPENAPLTGPGTWTVHMPSHERRRAVLDHALARTLRVLARGGHESVPIAAPQRPQEATEGEGGATQAGDSARAALEAHRGTQTYATKAHEVGK